MHERRQPVVQKINYTQLRTLGETSAASSLRIDGEQLTVTGRDGSISQAVVTNEAAQQEIIAVFAKSNVPVEFSSLQPSPLTLAMNWLIPILTLAAFGFIGWRIYASMGGRGSNFTLVDGNGRQNVNFGDVAGVDEAKKELEETIEFLRDPVTFGRLGGRAPRGILLSGPPGTGKTMLARAAANEAHVPFLSVSGSSFQEKFAGLGAARVRRLFAEARKLSPCVIFIDEIDALGRQRGRGNDSASADQDQTLNQLLV
ncbi:MAG: AAA family ATPase, partial [Acidobacteria bacterium]|nr:AAA family ATPase [Acidobacteriota bacterium]